MTQQELDQSVAHATGESLHTIRRRGFSIVNLPDVDFDPEPNLLPAQYVDWDALAQQTAGRAA